jgi:hypothetical protein
VFQHGNRIAETLTTCGGEKKGVIQGEDSNRADLAELRVVEFGEQAAAAHQLGKGVALGDDRVAQHQRQITIADRRPRTALRKR